MNLIIRKAYKVKDFEAIWSIFKAVIATGDTYVYAPDTPKEKLYNIWFGADTDTFVAEISQMVVGTFVIKPNFPDLGSHIANCSYMVHPAWQGKGIGKEMGQRSIRFIKEKGYKGIQFNIVVSTNEKAIKLWKSFGFQIIGTVPGAFRHSKFGFVDTYIMFLPLDK